MGRKEFTIFTCKDPCSDKNATFFGKKPPILFS